MTAHFSTPLYGSERIVLLLTYFCELHVVRTHVHESQSANLGHREKKKRDQKLYKLVLTGPLLAYELAYKGWKVARKCVTVVVHFIL